MFSRNKIMRNFFVLLTALLLLPLTLLHAADMSASPATPNIIFLLADDMRWDAMSCAGNPLLKTPNIDRLAAGGIRFENGFVTTSICAVSRASILTGQYARRHGVNDFKQPVSDLQTTYPVILRKNGYYTGFIGKWGVAAHDREYFVRCASEFDFWAGDMFQTAYWHQRNCNYVTNNSTSGRTNSFCSCPPQGRKGEGCGPNGPNPALQDPVHAETEFVPAKIRSFLDQRDIAKPFCLSVSFKAPHGPWQGFAPRFAGDFEGAAIPRRANVTLDAAMQQPEFLRSSLANDVGLNLAQDTQKRDEMFRQYYRLIEGVDFCVGEILKELQQRGLAGNTVILFTADNGHFSGEHGFFGKWFMHEESLRVPMLILDPRLPKEQAGKVCSSMVLNIDIAPTILELAGLKVPGTMQGESLAPLLSSPAKTLRTEFFYEHLYTHWPKPPKHIEPSEGVRTMDWKYITWLEQAGNGREELYDLRNDPLEMKNLVADHAAQKRLEEMRDKHKRFMAEVK